MHKIYLDTSVLLNMVAGITDRRLYEVTLKELDKIKRGENQAVISVLTLMELFIVLRNKRGRKIDELSKLNETNQLKFVHDKTMFHDITNVLSQLPNVQFSIKLEIGLHNVLNRAFHILKKTKGNVKLSKKGRYSYKGVGTDDVIHAVIAKDTNCDEFLTFDEGFDELNDGFNEFGSLSFIVLKADRNER